MYAFNAKSHPKEYDGVEKSDQKSDKSIGERAKLRRQKSDKLNEIIIEKDEIINRDLFKNYFFNFESLSEMQKKIV